MTEEVNQEERLRQNKRLMLSRDIKSLTLEEMDELQDWLDEKKEAERQALIKSINALISDMTVEALTEIEASLAETPDF